MSVIIKGMEKPSNCIWIDAKGDGKSCPLLDFDDFCKLQDCTEVETWEDQMRGCPLIEMHDDYYPLSDDSKFMTHLLTEICNYAVRNDMEPDHTIKQICDNFVALLKISTFNGWEGE